LFDHTLLLDKGRKLARNKASWEEYNYNKHWEDADIFLWENRNKNRKPTPAPSYFPSNLPPPE
jgi:hypothetical protein